MTPTEQDKELFNYLEKISEYNKLGGKGHGNFEDTCYICGISPSNLMELITLLIKELVAEARIDGAIMGAKFGNAALRQYNVAGKPMNLDEIRDVGIKQAEDWAKRQC